MFILCFSLTFRGGGGVEGEDGSLLLHVMLFGVNGCMYGDSYMYIYVRMCISLYKMF